MTDDKPEAGRTCAVWWCGGEDDPGESVGIRFRWRKDGHRRRWFCSQDCRNRHNGEPYGPQIPPAFPHLNPAPRPVEQSSAGDSLIIRGDGSGTYEFSGGRKVEYPAYQPRPVERCSCEEATRYKAALEAIDSRIGGFIGHPGTTERDIYDIARRALALGGEGT